MSAPLVLIPAAGASRRMGGRDKLLEPVAGVALLARQAARAAATGWPVLVTLPPDRPARAAVLEGVGTLVVADAAEGMAASLRAGAAEALRRRAEGMLVLLPDMPEITTDDLLALAAARRPGDLVLRAATEDGRAGHPVWFDEALLAEFAGLAGDEGAAPIVSAHRDALRLVPLAGERARLDLDTPEAWAAWRGGA
ncbi:hypothetical protein OG2516_04501 [Oceanicola granulosus HTCC2516]|uniref:MobA-like NTP transferase domain-containing protein n=1 Tax=Oceanicola granulosus (strain ATCC BAA-861 / DSM 15982 / KCTC 12143 / HTCC2516) TaxID=314256 RepID=Q2CD06_OCEGH|nr:NTP transferase domain-containing protein [Oceanicola granulosus]EAR50570.1 hypothetical protein OG2516_04501 [Oceanicola granulosus HTCC2516]